MIPVDRLGDDDDWPSEDEIDAGLDAGQLIHVEPLGSSVEYGWMAEFAATVGDAPLRDKLEIALDGRGAFRRFKTCWLTIRPSAGGGSHSGRRACARPRASGSRSATSSRRMRRQRHGRSMGPDDRRRRRGTTRTLDF
jgi:hypothetical protein